MPLHPLFRCARCVSSPRSLSKPSRNVNCSRRMALRKPLIRHFSVQTFPSNPAPSLPRSSKLSSNTLMIPGIQDFIPATTSTAAANLLGGVAEAALERTISNQSSTFLSVFEGNGGGDASTAAAQQVSDPGTVGESAVTREAEQQRGDPSVALEEWVQTYYRRPRPELLFGALRIATSVDGAFTGRAAFSGAIFLSLLFKKAFTAGKDPRAVLPLLQALRQSCLVSPSTTTSADAMQDSRSVSGALLNVELFETVLRAINLAQLGPAADAELVGISDKWIAEVEKEDMQTTKKTAMKTGLEGTIHDAKLKENSRDGSKGSSSSSSSTSLSSENDRDYLIALAKSLRPASLPRGKESLEGIETAAKSTPHFPSLLHWSIPSLSLDRFEKLMSSEASHTSPYALSSRWLFQLMRMGHLASKEKGANRATFSVLAPHIASEVTKAMVDGYWSIFYATGDAQAVTRVLDVGTPYVSFLEEYGDKYVTGYLMQQPQSNSRGPPGGGSSSENDGVEGDASRILPLPEEFEDDPLGAMRFETSRYALWTLLMNATTHTLVGDIFRAQLQALMDRATLVDPFSRPGRGGESVGGGGGGADGSMTAFGEQRLILMQALSPSLASLRTHAYEQGIGSGSWPASFWRGADTSHILREQMGEGSRLSASATLDSKDIFSS